MTVRRFLSYSGYNENGQQKWITQDNAMLVTQHDCLVKTLGLPDNLQEVSNLSQNPLADALHLRAGASWTRIAQWTKHSETRGANEVLTLAGRRVACRVWIEQARIEATSRAWENTF